MWARKPLGVRYSAPIQAALGLIQSPVQWVMNLFAGNKTAGAWRLPLTPHLLLSRTLDQTAAGRIKSMRNLIDPVGNRTLDLLVCTAVPRPPMPPRAPSSVLIMKEYPYNITS
jgi:hypothetical protein